MNDYLKQIFLFQSLDKLSLSELAYIAHRKTYREGEILFYEGDPSSYLHILIDGAVKIYKSDSNGNEIFLHRFYGQSLVAEMANFYSIPFPATAILEAYSTVLVIDYKAFETHFLRNPTVSFGFIQSLTQKIKHLENIIHSNFLLDASGRVAQFILENETTFYQFKRNDIAKMLNITPVTLSRIIKKFKNHEILSEENRKIFILNKQELQKIFMTF
jgi:CRP/FNR family transcriptional regulator